MKNVDYKILKDFKKFLEEQEPYRYVLFFEIFPEFVNGKYNGDIGNIYSKSTLKMRKRKNGYHIIEIEA